MRQKRVDILLPYDALEELVMKAWLSSHNRGAKVGEMVEHASKAQRIALKKLKSKTTQSRKTHLSTETGSKKRKSRLTKAVEKIRADEKEVVRAKRAKAKGAL